MQEGSMRKIIKKLQDRLFNGKQSAVLIDERYRMKLMCKCVKCKNKLQQEKYNCKVYKEEKIPPWIWCGQVDCENFIDENY